MNLRIGSRESDLAVAQTQLIINKLQSELNAVVSHIKVKTKGDLVRDRPLREIGGQGYFTKELEEALLNDRIDIAVHSFKDMPSKQHKDLCIAAYSNREDARDVLLIRNVSFDAGQIVDTPESHFLNTIPVKEGGIIGTSSVRRSKQVIALRSDLQVVDLRGNLPTRIKKLSSGQFDAIILAYAGIKRLNPKESSNRLAVLNPEYFVPAPGQGVLALQMKSNDDRIGTIKTVLNDSESELSSTLERKLMQLFGGGCSLPFGGYAYPTSVNEWRMFGFWGGDSIPRWGEATGEPGDGLVMELFNKLN